MKSVNNDVSIVSTMLAKAVAASRQHQINSNIMENNMKYNSMYNSQLYNESLEKLLSIIKPTELLQHYNCNQAMIHSTNQNSIRYHPYLKMNNNYSNILNSSHQLPVDLIYSQNEHHIQNVNISNQNNNSIKASDSIMPQMSINQKSPKQ
jgi:hypothetical protein